MKIWWSCFCGCWWFSFFFVLILCPLVYILIFMICIFFMRDSIFSRCLLILDLHLFSSKIYFFPYDCLCYYFVEFIVVLFICTHIIMISSNVCIVDINYRGFSYRVGIIIDKEVFNIDYVSSEIYFYADVSKNYWYYLFLRSL